MEDRSSYLGEVPEFPATAPLYFSPDRYASTRSAVYRVSPQDNGCHRPFDWLPEELYCSWFRDAPVGLVEEHGGALRDINGDPPFTQPPLYVAKIGLQVFD